jgi:hypothetical protein
LLEDTVLNFTTKLHERAKAGLRRAEPDFVAAAVSLAFSGRSGHLLSRSTPLPQGDVR